MKSENEEIHFYPKKKLDPKNLFYLKNEKNVYANLFEIKLTKNLQLYQYPFSVFPDVGEGDIRIRNMLFKGCSKQLKSIYGEECFILGDSLYSMKEVEEKQIIHSKLILKKVAKEKSDYYLEIEKYSRVETINSINQKNNKEKKIIKQFIEILIREILHANPKLEFYKGLFVMKNEKKTINTKNTDINFYPGFTTSFMETEKGNYLNVTLKNKIIHKNTILDYLKEKDYYNKNNQEDIAKNLIGQSFKVSYSNKNYKIFDILFNRNPTNQTFNYEGGTVKLIDYYQNIKKMKIKDEKQPIIVVKKKGPQDTVKMLYFIPELCFLAGLEESEVKDKDLMKQLALYTKLEPNERIKHTNRFLDLLVDNQKGQEGKMSAKEKSEKYGIEVSPVKESFKAYIMEQPYLLAGEKRYIDPYSKVFPVLEKAEMLSWLCFYEKRNYNDAEYLYNTLKKASEGFRFKINEPEWIEMDNGSHPKDWTATAEDYIGKGKDKYSFAIFLIGQKDQKGRLYTQLKKHSLCTNGYVSQVVKVESLRKKGVMSICSKILLQINAKLRGYSYKIQNEILDDKNLMIIGIDSSYIKRKGRGIAMVATMNDSFTDFYNQEEILRENEEENVEKVELRLDAFIDYVKKFIDNAIRKYKSENNDREPQGIIIYRQGVSLEQKQYLKKELEEIDAFLNQKNIDYYYILVNTKSTLKFFEIKEVKTERNKKGKNKKKEEMEVIKNYNNPEPGLLIIDGITNRNYFEFYIQPQEVTGGSATPTCFHLAYGNLHDLAEYIPKLTYDLCYIYSNWQGAVRVPNVIKAAEKLSKMTAKYTFEKLSPYLEFGQAYL